MGDFMKTIYENFYNLLFENLESFRGKHAFFINYGPKFFKLLVDLLENEDLENGFKLKVCAAIAYFVVPNDVVPEDVYGAYGYIDDIFLSTYVIKLVAERYGYRMLERYWEDDRDLEEVIYECHERSKEMLREKTFKVLEYVGF